MLSYFKDLFAKLNSSRIVVLVVIVTIAILNKKFDMGIPDDQMIATILFGMSYVLGKSYENAKVAATTPAAVIPQTVQ